MKTIVQNSFFLVLALTLFSCIREPQFNEVPKISFNDVSFVRGADDSDTIFVSINFEDGDGDLGLRPTEVAPPYHDMDLFLASNGQKVPYSTSDGALNPDLYQKIGEPGLPAYNCDSYLLYSYDKIINGVTVPTTDTLFVEYNPRRNNYFIEFYIKENGVFNLYEFISSPGQCPSTFNDSFLPLFEDGNDDKPLSGILNRKIQFLFGIPEELYLREDILKIHVYILDRAGNASNVAESNEFTLKQIEAN